MGNLEISRVNNVIYRSSHVLDNTRGMERSRSDFLLDYRIPQSSVTPKITFQIRPSAKFQNSPIIGQTPMNSPIPLIQSNGQTSYFPPPSNVLPSYYVINGQSAAAQGLKTATTETVTNKVTL